MRKGIEDRQEPWRPQPGTLRRPPVAPSHQLVRFEGQTPDHYLVRDLTHDDVSEVPKRYAVAAPFPVTRTPRQRGARLLRWSVWALAGAVLGGVLGVVLGAFVALAALLRLVAFGDRVRRWRQHHADADAQWLPAAAAIERQRLRAALGQGLLALLLGAGVLTLLLPYLLLYLR